MKVRATLAALVALAVTPLRAQSYSVSSPDGHLTVTVTYADSALTYSVSHSSGRMLVEPSPLGLVTDVADFSHGVVLSGSHVSEVDDSYELPVGKQSRYRDHCRVLSVTVARGSRQQTVEMRLYDDGFAYRYLLPAYDGDSSMQVTEDSGRVRVAGLQWCLGCRFADNPIGNNPNYPYEAAYARYDWPQLTALPDARLNAPALLHNGSEYLLLSEADNRGIFSASLLLPCSSRGEFAYCFAGEHKDYRTLHSQSVTVNLPAQTPWRMVAIGSLQDIFQTTLAENLCPPTRYEDTSWIRPGRAGWYWGGSDGNVDQFRQAYGTLRDGELAYVDLAADMGWEYTTIDGGWSAEWVPQVVRHAREHGVGALLWQTATLSSDRSFSMGNMERTLRQWSEWGIVGVKIDFWEDDSHETMERMERLLDLCARYHMLVDLHGCIRPSGLRRTYPHLMTQEGIFGGEQNFWHYDQVSPEHHVNMLYTRCVVGAADFTPGDIASFRGLFFTNASLAHRLALLTAIESGIVHICESPANLQYFLGRDIMKRFPVAWDESRLLEGEVQQYATIARRKGTDWWLSGVCVDSRTSRIKMDFLEKARTYVAYVYRDGNCRTDLRFEKRKVRRGDTLILPCLSGGGFLVQVTPDANLPVPASPVTYEAEASCNTLSPGVKRENFSSLHASGGVQVNEIGLGRSLQWNGIRVAHEGDYLLTLYYSTKDDRQATLLVDGEVVEQQARFYGNGGYPSSQTRSFGADGMGFHHLVVHLGTGRHSVCVQSPADGWAPNFDRLTLTPLTPKGK